MLCGAAKPCGGGLLGMGERSTQAVLLQLKKSNAILTGMNTTPIQQAVKVAGSQSALAKAVNAAPQFVSQWVTGRRPVPPKFALAVEAKFGISRHDLRPDVFGERKRRGRAA